MSTSIAVMPRIFIEFPIFLPQHHKHTWKQLKAAPKHVRSFAWTLLLCKWFIPFLGHFFVRKQRVQSFCWHRTFWSRQMRFTSKVRTKIIAGHWRRFNNSACLSGNMASIFLLLLNPSIGGNFGNGLNLIAFSFPWKGFISWGVSWKLPCGAPNRQCFLFYPTKYVSWKNLKWTVMSKERFSTPNPKLWVNFDWGYWNILHSIEIYSTIPT